MPTEVIMPKVDMDMESGRISVWHVGEGDEVAAGDPLFDIETDKAAMEVESPAAGRVGTISATVGDDVPIGRTVAWIYGEGEPIADAPSDDALPRVVAQEPSPRPEPDLALPAVDERADEPAEKVRATPLARRLARQHGLALGDVRGTGPGGRIGRSDIEAFVEDRGGEDATEQAARVHIASPSAPEPSPRAAAGDLAIHRSGGDLAIHRSGGDDGAPFVMLHGITGDSSTWARLERRLKANRPIVKIDLPCHGRSPLDAVDDFETLVARVLAAFDGAGFDKVHLVGHSLGGAVAAALADQRPRAIASLTLLAPAGLGAGIDADTLYGIARASRAESLAPWLKRLTADPDRIGWDYVKAAMAARADERLRSAQTRLIDRLFPDATQSFEISSMLARVDAPTRIVWGREDRVAPWRQALAAPDRAALHLLRDVGHMPQMEAAHTIADLLRQQAALGDGGTAA